MCYMIGSMYSETISLTSGNRGNEGEPIFPGHFCAVLVALCPRHGPLRTTAAHGWVAGPHDARYHAASAFTRLAPFILLPVCGCLGENRALQGAWHDAVWVGVHS